MVINTATPLNILSVRAENQLPGFKTFKFSINVFVLETVANCVAHPHVRRAIVALDLLRKVRDPCSDKTHLKPSTLL